MIVTVFRSRLKDKGNKKYYETAERMEALARGMPGFLSFKTFKAEDGERVSIVEFKDMKSHDAWRNHPEHLEAQSLGREEFYSEYKIQVLNCVRERVFIMDQE